MNLDLGLMPGKWADDAACNGDPWPDAWHPGDNATTSVAMSQYALAVCKGCPVKRECLNFAISAGPSDAAGIWGMTTQEQRKKLWRA